MCVAIIIDMLHVDGLRYSVAIVRFSATRYNKDFYFFYFYQYNFINLK